MQKPRRVSLPIFRCYETFPAPFFGFVRLFSKFFKVFKGSPLLFFWCFAPEWMLKKPKGPPFTFFGTETVKNSHFLFFFGKFLANWTKMVLPVFPRNIPYRARPKSPPFQFFCCFATEWMLENPKGFLLSVFFGIVRFFPENKNKFSSIFSCFATEWMLKNLKGSPLSVFRHCEVLARQSVHFFSM